MCWGAPGGKLCPEYKTTNKLYIFPTLVKLSEARLHASLSHQNCVVSPSYQRYFSYGISVL